MIVFNDPGPPFARKAQVSRTRLHPMSISITRFPEFKLGLIVFRDLIDAAEVLDFFRGPDADRHGETRRLTYIDPGADLSQLDLMSITELKRVIDRKRRERALDESFRIAIVSNSRRNDPIVNLWKGYVGRDPDHLSKPVVFSSLEGACAYLGLPAEAREALAQAVGLRTPHPAARGEVG
jgi:hypothetical protein